MRAYTLESLDARPQLVDVPQPTIGPDEVLVRVVASSVNPHDLHVLSGAARAYMEYRFPVTLGNDLSGVVEEVGTEVTRFNHADEVFGVVQEPVAHRGTFADYVALPADRFIVRKPDRISHAEAGALGLVTTAALACLEPFDEISSAVILVNGATGGVGTAVAQIAGSRGAHVIATARPGREEDVVRSIGCVDVVDWTAGDVGAMVRERYPMGIDGLIDLVNSDPDALVDLARHALRPGGHVISTLQAADQQRLPEMQCSNVFASPRPELLEEMRALVERGVLRPVLSEAYGLEDIDKAHAALEAGSLGKIGIRLNSRLNSE